MEDKNSHITEKEIQQDILVTECEIMKMELEIQGLKIMSKFDRLSDMKLNSKIEGIKERKEFIEKLKLILKNRMKNKSAQELGSIKTLRKAKSSALNGLKGGRPKKKNVCSHRNIKISDNLSRCIRCNQEVKHENK